MGVHPKSGRIVRDIKYLKTANRLHTLMGSGAGSRIRTDDRLITNQLLALFWHVLWCSPLTTKKTIYLF